MIYVRLYTYSTLEHEHIVIVDSLHFYLEQDKGLWNAMWQHSENYSSHSFITAS